MPLEIMDQPTDERTVTRSFLDSMNGRGWAFRTIILICWDVMKWSYGINSLSRYSLNIWRRKKVVFPTSWRESSNSRRKFLPCNRMNEAPPTLRRFDRSILATRWSRLSDEAQNIIEICWSVCMSIWLFDLWSIFLNAWTRRFPRVPTSEDWII